MTNNISVDEALNSIKEIRAIINRSEQKGQEVATASSIKLSIVIQSIAFLIGLFFLLGEISGNVTTLEFARSVNDSSFRNQGLINLALILSSLTACMFVLLKIGAKESDQSLKGYLQRNFPGLMTVTFFSDLMVKYSAVAIAVLALSPQYIAPLCLIFLADYLLQGKFFTFPYALSCIVASLLIGLAIYQINSGQMLLSQAFFAFCALSFGSLVVLARRLTASKKGN